MRFLPIILLITAALAGCAGGDDDTTTTSTTPTTSSTTTSTSTTSTTSSTSSTTSSTTTTAPPAENTAPTATLSATTENGTFNVTFDIDGADEDGDELSWSLDADGDGTEDAGGEGDLPAQYVHDYGAAGNYTATLTVSDGEDEVERTADIVLEAGGATSTSFAYEEGALTGSSPAAIFTGALDCPGFLAGESGTNCVFTALPEGMGGLEYSARSDVVPNVVVDWWDSCDPTAGASLELHTVEDGAPESPVPEGAGCVVLASYGDAPMPTLSVAIGDAVTA